MAISQNNIRIKANKEQHFVKNYIYNLIVKNLENS